jgi:hypothetical protein
MIRFISAALLIGQIHTVWITQSTIDTQQAVSHWRVLSWTPDAPGLVHPLSRDIDKTAFRAPKLSDPTIVANNISTP